MKSCRSLAAIFLLLALPVVSRAQSDVVDKIKDEGLNKSQVMQTLSYLSDVIGPRLTCSPNAKRANEWTRDQLTKWGCYNAHLEPWGPFGRGWSLQRFSAQVVEPQCFPVIAYPKAWSPGLKKPITADVVYVDAKTEADLEKYKGKLKGAIVLGSPMATVRAHFDPQGTRWTDKQLADMAAASAGGERPRPNRAPRQGGPGGPASGPNADRFAEFRAQMQMAGKKAQFYMDEGVAVIVDVGRGDGGTVFVQQATVPQPPDRTPAAGRAGNAAGTPTAGSTQGATPIPGAAAPQAGQAGGRRRGAGQDGQPGAGGGPNGRRISPWDKSAPKMLPQVTVSAEHYNRVLRMVQAGEKVKMAVDLQVQFHDKDLMSYNTIAEIPGTDLKDQIVMLGGHMDSWQAGTGATDNGAGCAVALEAMRIIQSLGLKPRRTIRIALWTGEEEGLMGSRAYVAEHFGSRPGGGFGGGGFGGGGGTAPAEAPKLTTKPDYEKLSGYFNLDNGTGKIRGVYLQGNKDVGPIFAEWLKPFNDMGASTITINNTGGTDHQSFDGIGLPGFQFIQDEIEYDSRTHHSNMDVFDRIQADDMKQASVIMATFVYNTAMRDEMLPRKPKPGSATN